MLSRLFHRHPLSLLSAGVVLIAGLVFANPALAQDIVRIEEDWEVQIATPDPAGDAPQIITAMSSTNRLEDVHCIFEMNHSTLPDYNSGGMGLQIWSSDTNLTYMVHPKTGPLSTDGEVITYSMTMTLTGGDIVFEVKNGSSDTWGNFGIGYFKTSVPTSQTAFTLYSPDVSVANSKVGFAKNRVQKFVLKQVRYYSVTGEIEALRDTTERVVHQLN